jgi:transglutaminase-like putative cysteine protease
MVVAFARATAGDAEEPREVARRLFVAVREGIRYDPYTIDYDRASYRASDALSRGRSFCIPKATAYAAALRAVGIPARLGFADVTNHFSSQRLLETLGTNVFAFHGYTEVWLDGKWWKATPAFNASLCARFGVPPLEFDGTADAVLQPYGADGPRFMEYLRDRGRFDDLPFEEEEAIRAAVAAVAPAVVRLETAGVSEAALAAAAEANPASGPSTATVVAAGGWLVATAFAVPADATEAIVVMPSATAEVRTVARVVGRDLARGLVLLRVADDAGLPPPPPSVPRAELAVGQWTIAVGRGWNAARRAIRRNAESIGLPAIRIVATVRAARGRS